jgi:hypothetical protein
MLKKAVRLRIIGFILVLLLTSAGSTLAYEEAPVTDGGVLAGKVTLTGDIPKPKGYNLTTLPDAIYCGRISDGRGWRLLQPFHVGSNGAFQDVVVLIEGIEKGKPFLDFKPPRIEALDCRFMPFTTVVRDQHDVTVVNMDPAMHDIQAYETSHLGPRVLFNVPLPISARYPKEAGLSAHFQKHYAGTPMTQTVKMTKGRRVFVMQCGFHAYMESWALTVDDPYYAITDKEGRFTIGDVPPGTYRVLVWHPYIAGGSAKEFTVTIQPKTQTTLDVQIPAPTGRLYANQMVENPFVRYNITEDVQSQIVPTLERQTY